MNIFNDQIFRFRFRELSLGHPCSSKEVGFGSGLQDKYPLLVNGMLTKRRKRDVLQIKNLVCVLNEMSMFRLMTVVDVRLVWRD